MSVERHKPETKAKIGASRAASAWRNQAGTKTSELQSPSPWLEDYSTPLARRVGGSSHLWEEEYSD